MNARMGCWYWFSATVCMSASQIRHQCLIVYNVESMISCKCKAKIQFLTMFSIDFIAERENEERTTGNKEKFTWYLEKDQDSSYYIVQYYENIGEQKRPLWCLIDHSIRVQDGRKMTTKTYIHLKTSGNEMKWDELLQGAMAVGNNRTISRWHLQKSSYVRTWHSTTFNAGTLEISRGFKHRHFFELGGRAVLADAASNRPVSAD